MTASAQSPHADIRVSDVAVNDEELTVRLMDGRTLSVPVVRYPRRAEGTPERRSDREIAAGGHGIHWPRIDEDPSAEGLLRGARAPRPR